MKTKKIKKKLVLGKATITNLETREMDSVQGGARGTFGTICINYSLAPQICPYTETPEVCTWFVTCTTAG